MNIQTLKLSQLKPSAYNPRSISDEALARLEASTAEFGLVEPLVVNKRTGYTVVGGHQRLKLLEKRGVKEVECTVVDLPLSKEKALNVALNSTAMQGIYDFSKLADLLQEIDTGEFDVSALTGFDASELERIANWSPSTDKEETEPVPEPPKKAKSRLGDVWELGRHRLMCGDSTRENELATLMNGKLAAFCFTDPPYGVQFAGKGGKSIAGDQSYTAIPLFFSMLSTVLEKAAWIYICGGANNMTLYGRMFEHYFKQLPKVVVWDKGGMVMRHNGYQSSYEFIYYTYTTGAGDWWFGSRAGEAATDIWRVKPPGNEREHLTEKPVELPERAIANTCPENGLVFEPFCGSGSTLIAAEKLGRRCYAMEIEPRYVDVSVARWQNFTGKKAKNLTRKAVTIA